MCMTFVHGCCPKKIMTSSLLQNTKPEKRLEQLQKKIYAKKEILGPRSYSRTSNPPSLMSNKHTMPVIPSYITEEQYSVRFWGTGHHLNERSSNHLGWKAIGVMIKLDIKICRIRMILLYD